jgi:hypothetical protein
MRFFTAFVAFMMILSVGAQAAENHFFTEMADIPVMPGLYELADENMVFDKPEGRIIESAAASETRNHNEIKAFYDTTLPQMGWHRLSDGQFRRGAERLSIRLETRGNLQIMRLSLIPAGP